MSPGNLIIIYLPLCLQDVALSNSKNEQALGQLLVLTQHDWPREEEIFASIITTIQKRRCFNFPEFFKYIVGILMTTVLRMLLHQRVVKP